MQEAKNNVKQYTRSESLYELRMLVLGYMQNEDRQKAAEAFSKWKTALKIKLEVANESVCAE